MVVWLANSGVVRPSAIRPLVYASHHVCGQHTPDSFRPSSKYQPLLYRQIPIGLFNAWSAEGCRHVHAIPWKLFPLWQFALAKVHSGVEDGPQEKLQRMPKLVWVMRSAVLGRLAFCRCCPANRATNIASQYQRRGVPTCRRSYIPCRDLTPLIFSPYETPASESMSWKGSHQRLGNLHSTFL